MIGLPLLLAVSILGRAPTQVQGSEAALVRVQWRYVPGATSYGVRAISTPGYPCAPNSISGSAQFFCGVGQLCAVDMDKRCLYTVEAMCSTTPCAGPTMEPDLSCVNDGGSGCRCDMYRAPAAPACP